MSDKKSDKRMPDLVKDYFRKKEIKKLKDKWKMEDAEEVHPDTPAPLTYTPAQVIEMVRKALGVGMLYMDDLNKDETTRSLQDVYDQLLTTLGLNQ